MRKVSVVSDQRGFTIVELLLACVIFPIIVGGVSVAYNSVTYSYRTAKRLNEVYMVISACPEVDRALEFDSITSTANCYPNNSFKAEGNGASATITYAPAITVTNTTALSSTDSLKNVYDSKVIDISVPYPNDAASPPVKLRLLITRNGIGQL